MNAPQRPEAGTAGRPAHALAPLATWARRLAPFATLLAALWLLNAALTFHNVWPTPAIELRGEWSLELALLVLALGAFAAWRKRMPGRRALGALAALLLLFTLARYAEVTAPALYGRGVNLYWDARHVGGAVAMLVQVARPWQLALGFAVLVFAIGAALWLLRAALARVVRALDPAARAPTEVVARRLLLACAAGAALLFGVDAAGGLQQRSFGRFSIPVTQTWAGQFALLGGSWLAQRRAAAPGAEPGDGAGIAAGPESVPGAGRWVRLPALHTPVGVPRGDVHVVFVESYGAVAWQRKEIASRLVASRAALTAALAQGGRAVVSGWVTSPTFGSGSWLAHASLLSGTEVRDGDDYARLLLRPRPTLADVFRADGYRVLALMPGLRQAWPEGEYFRFDTIYGADALDYRGPAFGWFRIPDQFALERLDRLEAARPASAVASASAGTVAGGRATRQPTFVFFPTISSHMPFRPTPPYQQDWARLVGATPFGTEAEQALAQAPEWTNLAPAYGDSIGYALRVLAGYLERHAGEPLTMLVLGDHQPPAAVSGEGAVREVPVHVISDRPEVLESLLAHGFVPGLDPAGGTRGPMHALGPWLLEALGTAPRSPAGSLRAARTGTSPQGLAVVPGTLPN